MKCIKAGKLGNALRTILVNDQDTITDIRRRFKVDIHTWLVYINGELVLETTVPEKGDIVSFVEFYWNSNRNHPMRILNRKCPRAEP